MDLMGPGHSSALDGQSSDYIRIPRSSSTNGSSFLKYRHGSLDLGSVYPTL